MSAKAILPPHLPFPIKGGIITQKKIKITLKNIKIIFGFIIYSIYQSPES